MRGIRPVLCSILMMALLLCLPRAGWAQGVVCPAVAYLAPQIVDRAVTQGTRVRFDGLSRGTAPESRTILSAQPLLACERNAVIQFRIRARTSLELLVGEVGHPHRHRKTLTRSKTKELFEAPIAAHQGAIAHEGDPDDDIVQQRLLLGEQALDILVRTPLLGDVLSDGQDVGHRIRLQVHGELPDPEVPQLAVRRGVPLEEEALAAARHDESGGAPLPYLVDASDQARGAWSVVVSVELSSRAMREMDLAPMLMSTADLATLFWTPAQLIAHHTANGCALEPGDLLATGTISGPGGRSQAGSLLEITRGGREPLTLPTGESRQFLEDGDEVTLTARASAPGCVSIGFGTCRARISAARPSPP